MASRPQHRAAGGGPYHRFPLPVGPAGSRKRATKSLTAAAWHAGANAVRVQSHPPRVDAVMYSVRTTVRYTHTHAPKGQSSHGNPLAMSRLLSLRIARFLARLVMRWRGALATRQPGVLGGKVRGQRRPDCRVLTWSRRCLVSMASRRELNRRGTLSLQKEARRISAMPRQLDDLLPASAQWRSTALLWRARKGSLHHCAREREQRRDEGKRRRNTSLDTDVVQEFGLHKAHLSDADPPFFTTNHDGTIAA